MKNYINYTKSNIVTMNFKRGFNRPMKVNVKAFPFFNDLTEENAKLRFAPVQITFEKMMNK